MAVERSVDAWLEKMGMLAGLQNSYGFRHAKVTFKRVLPGTEDNKDGRFVGSCVPYIDPDQFDSPENRCYAELFNLRSLTGFE